MPYANPEDQRACERRYYLENRERIQANVKAWQADNWERVKGYKKAWLDANPDYKREWYLANRERVLEQCWSNYQKRLKENPDHVRDQKRSSRAKRRARERAAFVEQVDFLVVWDRDKGICQICGDPADLSNWHLDHIVPIARGGEHSYANVQVAHPVCNRRKWAHL